MSDEKVIRDDGETWRASFDEAAYKAAREVLEQDKQRAFGEIKQLSRRRGKTVGLVAVAWAVCSVVLAVVNPELLLVAEIGWAAIVAWAVFFLYPMFSGQANLDELFEQYAARLDALEQAQVALPMPSDMGDLVAALDLVTLPDDDASQDSAQSRPTAATRV